MPCMWIEGDNERQVQLREAPAARPFACRHLQLHAWRARASAAPFNALKC